MNLGGPARPLQEGRDTRAPGILTPGWALGRPSAPLAGRVRNPAPCTPRVAPGALSPRSLWSKANRRLSHGRCTAPSPPPPAQRKKPLPGLSGSQSLQGPGCGHHVAQFLDEDGLSSQAPRHGPSRHTTTLASIFSLLLSLLGDHKDAGKVTAAMLDFTAKNTKPALK